MDFETFKRKQRNLKKADTWGRNVVSYSESASVFYQTRSPAIKEFVSRRMKAIRNEHPNQSKVFDQIDDDFIKGET